VDHSKEGTKRAVKIGQTETTTQFARGNTLVFERGCSATASQRRSPTRILESGSAYDAAPHQRLVDPRSPTYRRAPGDSDYTSP